MACADLSFFGSLPECAEIHGLPEKALGASARILARRAGSCQISFTWRLNRAEENCRATRSRGTRWARSFFLVVLCTRGALRREKRPTHEGVFFSIGSVSRSINLKRVPTSKRQTPTRVRLAWVPLASLPTLQSLSSEQEP